MFGVSRRLSVTTDGSSINASLGGVSDVAVVVTQSGAPPVALDAVQPAGSAGAVTESKFSLNDEQGVGGGVGAGTVAVAVRVGVGVPVKVAVGVGVGDGVPVKIPSVCV